MTERTDRTERAVALPDWTGYRLAHRCQECGEILAPGNKGLCDPCRPSDPPWLNRKGRRDT